MLEFIGPDIEFQSSLPHGSDLKLIFAAPSSTISILAPSRERLWYTWYDGSFLKFQSSLPHGSDCLPFRCYWTIWNISILAPSRERLPCGQCLGCRLDISILAPSRERRQIIGGDKMTNNISILAPSRERRKHFYKNFLSTNFNPRSLTGATIK